MIRTLSLLTAAAAILSAAALEPLQESPRLLPANEAKIGRLIDDLHFKPVRGKKLKLSDLKSAKAVVIAITSTSCPVTKRYASTLAVLEKEFAERGVKFVFINPIESDSASDIRAVPFAGPYIHDAKQQLAGALGARSAAEVFVLDSARTLVYRGAIDDQYGVSYSRENPQHRYLVEALEAVLAGNAPAIRATTAPGCALEVPAQKQAAAPVTYHARVSRIVQQNCLECHRAGGVAPFSLETYKDVTSHAGMIRKQVEKGAMPPWFAAPMTNVSAHWLNDRTLTAEDKADLVAWLNGSRAEGDPADAPLARQFASTWQIGEPDAIIRIPKPIEVKANGVMPYQNVYVETNFGEDRWVQAVEVLPTARQVVHHALIHVIPKDRAEGARNGRGRAINGDGFFAAYVPGNNILQFPDGFGKLIPAGATVRFQLHYTPNGTAASDQTALGLVFSKTKPKYEIRVSAVAARPDIPPGEANYELRGVLPVPFDAKLISFMPHMHVRGKSYRYELKTPAGEKTLLLDVPRYDFNWQLQYKLAQFIDAPAGSQILGTAVYDNSVNNPANPDPTARVKWGEQTFDEMMLGYIEYYVPSQEAGAPQTSLIELAMRDGGVVFSSLDKNHDGKITPDETPSPKEFKDADADGDGVVTREEFAEYWKRRTRGRSVQ
jgi:mono/diheme cytochrome c family protein